MVGSQGGYGKIGEGAAHRRIQERKRQREKLNKMGQVYGWVGVGTAVLIAALNSLWTPPAAVFAIVVVGALSLPLVVTPENFVKLLARRKRD